MRQWVHKLVPLLVMAMFCGAVGLLFHELKQYRLQDIRSALAAVPASRVLAAVVLTALNYGILIGYDWIAIRSIDHSLPLRRVALASFAGFATSYNFGALLGGTSIRFRLYSTAGLSAVEILRMVVMLGVTFWVGVLALAGTVFMIDPFPVPDKLRLPFTTVRPLGAILAILAVGYVALTAVWHRPLRLRGTEFQLPRVRTTLLQLAVAAADLTVAAATLYVLLPRGLGLAYWQFLGVYLLAVVIVIITHVPGGVGVFELTVLTMAAGRTDEHTVAALLLFRVIYYLLPLVTAMALLAMHEIRYSRRVAVEAAAGIGRWTTLAAPRIFAVTIFVAGVMLLFSGATPAAHGRLRLLREIFPLPVIELSHLLGSVVGIFLILLAHSLQRRIETAYYAVLGLLIGGIGFSVVKGFDYEEAIVLSAMLVVFVPCRTYFYRKGALFAERFSPGWFIAIGLVIGCTLWLTLFAYKHVEYSNELWWQVTFRGNAARSLRAMASAVLVALIFATSRLLRSGPKPPGMPTAADLDAARRIVASSPRASANLALVGDKYRWFNLGMAPLSGLDAQALGPLWNRIAVIAYRHGEHFYHFQGLRQYKGKFGPVWHPKYLASPGGFTLPIILTNVTTLISGGRSHHARDARAKPGGLP